MLNELDCAIYDQKLRHGVTKEARLPEIPCKVQYRILIIFFPAYHIIGNRSLKENLAAAVGTMSDESRVQGYVTKQETAHDNDEEQEEEEEDISENLEILIEMLLNGLRDKDTVVRWSAAKGIGRITQRLPKDFAEDVIGSLLELFKENTLTDAATGKMDLSAVSDSTWHGVSLAIAELARRGLLLPHRLSETIPWIIMVSSMATHEEKRNCS